jgi:hypothetical protein
MARMRKREDFGVLENGMRWVGHIEDKSIQNVDSKT